MIWLGYPEEESGGGEDGALKKAMEAIEEVTEANERIIDCETALGKAMKKLDEALKREEKKEWIGALHLRDVTPEMTWGEIGDVFRGMYSTEGLVGEEAPEAFCTECGGWIPAGGIQCSDHGSADNTVLMHSVDRLSRLLAEVEASGERWGYGSGGVPFGRLDHDLSERVEAVLDDGGCDGPLREFEKEVGRVISGMKELMGALEEMRKAGESGGSTSSELKDFVKGIRSLKIGTVDNVVMDGKRWLVEHRIPGRSGADSSVSASIIQDMGRMPMRISFRGVLSGDGTMDERNPVSGPAMADRRVVQKLELLKWFYKKRAPLLFACNFLNRADMATKVLIEDLQFEEEQIVNHQVSFGCTLVEYSDVHWEGAESMEKQARSIREGVEVWAQYQTLEMVTGYRKRYEGDPVTKAVAGAIMGGKLK